MASNIETSTSTSSITTKVSVHSVAATCPLGSPFQGTGLSTGVSGLLGLSATVPAPWRSSPCVMSAMSDRFWRRQQQ